VRAGPVLVAIVGPTAAGKSALGLSLARRLRGEIVACDSTAVYRGIDIGTDKLPASEQQGIAHHMVDIVPPTETYSAARYAADASAVIREISARGAIPILVGGTGFYYRALIRGLFPGPARNDPIRARLDRVASRRGVECLHRWLQRVDAASAARIQPRDRKRLVRALEVYLLTGRPLTDHFTETVSPLAEYRVVTIGLTMERAALRERVTRRVDAQLAAGVVDEVRGLLVGGVPADAHAFSGLVYRQIVEMLQGKRSESETRDLIVRENMRYARRQVIWFRKEPDIEWLDGAGETVAVQQRAFDVLSKKLEHA
jgi:tRNA dimethylallyltransferase